MDNSTDEGQLDLEYKIEPEQSEESSGDGAAVPLSTGREDHPGVDRARTVSRLLDDAVEVPGTNFRIGIDPILGILPVAGDLVAAGASLYIILEAVRVGMPRKAIGKMLALLLVDFLIGSIPVIGVVFDAFWKPNQWNVSRLEDYVEQTS